MSDMFSAKKQAIDEFVKYKETHQQDLKDAKMTKKASSDDLVNAANSMYASHQAEITRIEVARLQSLLDTERGVSKDL